MNQTHRAIVKSGILAVGTELTDGQILNRNASWLSKRLKSLGLRTFLQLTVPDDRTAIREGLDYLSRDCDWIFVTGGLGPTSDDFTRELIAEWSGCELELHEPSWQHVQDRLSARNYPIHDFQKQQCYFPRGSTVLQNPQGTANGFRIHARDRWLIILPGPPREIEAVWNESLLGWLKQETLTFEKIITRSWDCIGLGESQVAALIEPVVKKFSVSPLYELGYRVHLPYVEAKVTFSSRHAPAVQGLISGIEHALEGYIISRDEMDIGETFARLVANRKVSFVDSLTGSFLQQRIGPLLRSNMDRGGFEFICGKRSAVHRDAEITFTVEPQGIHGAKISMTHRRQPHSVTIEAPMKSALLSERRQQYFAELALVTWSSWLQS